MKTKIVFLLIVILLSVPACSASSSSLELTCNDFREQQHIKKDLTMSIGDEITISLCSNPSTGFQWLEQSTISDNKIVQQTGYQYVAPRGKGGQPPAPGSAGNSVWTFKALESGEVTIDMEYSRPWEGGEKKQWTCELSVKVK